MTSTDRNTSPDRSAGPASGGEPETARGPEATAGAPPRPPLPRRAADRLLAFAQRPYRDRPDPSYRIRRRPDLVALCFATVFRSSLTPSLVPRPRYLQGVVGGITAVIGYLLGSGLARIVRALPGAGCRATGYGRRVTSPGPGVRSVR